MATFADMTAKLGLDFSNFTSGLRNASAQASKFAADLSGKINNGMVDPVKKAKFEFKDVARIVQGILISKAFYGGLNAIRSATSAVWDFSKELEYAQVVYTNLFSSSELATEFINVLKDFAAVTPFTFSQSEAAAKRLLAYGIQYKNVMYIMKGVLAASTVQGNPAVIETISRALGQIYTKGRLMNEEMRQLAESGVPVYEILAEKLGLTNKELRNLGKTAIPASVAINALVDGINERFGNVLNTSSKTINGILSNILDNSLMLMSNITAGLTNKIKGMLDKFGTWLSELRAVSDTGGIGAVFEKIIPPGLQSTVRILITNLLNLASIIKTALASAWILFKQVVINVAYALNVILPIINMVLGALVGLFQAIVSNSQSLQVLANLIIFAAMAWAVYKVHALTALVTTAVMKAIIASVKGLIVALNFLVAHPVWALLAFGLALLVSFSGAASKIGDSVRNIFKSFSKLGGTDPDSLLLPSQKERANDLSKFNERLGDTSSAMDNLADSTGKATKAAKGLLSFDEVFKLNQPDEGAGSGGANDFGDFAMPDLSGLGGAAMPSFDDFNLFSTDFVNNLLEALGGKKKLLSAGIGTILGTALGMIIGGPLGAKIGSIAGALAGWFWPEVASALGLTDVGTLALPIASVLGAAIGFIAGGPLGAAIGTAIGGLVGWLIDAITRTIQTSDWTGLPMPIGIGLGAAIGMVAGGPIGAAIGAAVGGLVGWIVKLFANNWTAITDWTKQAGKDIGGTFSDIGDWFGEIGKSVSQFFTGFGASMTTGFDAALLSIGTFFTTMYTTFITWFESILLSIGTFFTNVGISITTWFNTLITNISTWLSRIVTSIGTWFSTTISKIGEFLSTMTRTISQGLVNGYTAFTSFFSRVLSSVVQFGSNLASNFGSALRSVVSTVSNWTSNIYGIFRDWIQNLWNNVFGKFFNWIDQGIDKLKDFFGIDTSTAPKTTKKTTTLGHSVGGVFNKEHIAKFAEGNKTEAIIPLENKSAMQPFVDAVSNGIISSLAPLIATLANQSDSQRTPLYVGTLIADDRGIKELERKMQVIRLQESNRGG